MIKKNIILILLSICTLSLSAGKLIDDKTKKSIKYYISPHGNDNNDGTLKNPLKTLEKARDLIREMNHPLKDNIEIILRGGRYQLDRTIEFDWRDSGNGDFFITFKAFPGERPVLSGGIEISKYKETGNKIIEADIDQINFRQLYINGKRAMRARNLNMNHFYRMKYWDCKKQEIVINKDYIDKWKNLNEVEIIIQMMWAEAIMKIDSFYTNGEYAHIITKEPERSLVFKRFYPVKEENESFHFENALEFIDERGEWYYDKLNNKLFYKKLEADDQNIEIIIPKLETLIKITGTSAKPVMNLRFEGLTFSHSSWMKPLISGVLNSQAGQYCIEPTHENYQYVARPPAAVLLSGVKNIIFEKNIFSHLGATGLDFHYGVSNIIINGNIYFDISGNGITIAKFSDSNKLVTDIYNPTDETEICENIKISNNIISRTGVDYPGCCGIACGYPKNMIIENNEVFDLPYTGISVGWGWSIENNVMRNIIIRNNHIFEVLKLYCDGGGIYTLSNQPESQIKENYIHDIHKSDWATGSLNNGIFLDQGSSGITIERNVFKNIDDGNIRHNSTGIITLINNETADQAVVKKAGLQQEYRYLNEIFIKGGF